MPRFYALASVVTLSSSNNVIKFTEAGGPTLTATIDVTNPDFFLYGHASEAGDLCEAIKDALDNAPSAAGTYDVEYTGKLTAGGVTGEVTLTNNASNLEILSSASGTTFDLGLIGLPDADTGELQIVTSSLSPSATWTSNQPERIADRGPWRAETTQHLTPEGQSYVFEGSDLREFRRLAFELVNDDRTFTDDAGADPARSFETFWKNRLRSGQRFRLYRDDGDSAGDLGILTSADLIDTYTLTEGPLKTWDPARSVEGLAAYTWALLSRTYVS